MGVPTVGREKAVGRVGGANALTQNGKVCTAKQGRQVVGRGQKGTYKGRWEGKNGKVVSKPSRQEVLSEETESRQGRMSTPPGRVGREGAGRGRAGMGWGWEGGRWGTGGEGKSPPRPTQVLGVFPWHGARRPRVG